MGEAREEMGEGTQKELQAEKRSACVAVQGKEMKINDLKHGAAVTARWGRAGREAPKWGAWTTVKLHIQNNKKGVPCIIALQGINWAEYTPDDFEASTGVFVVEDYYLKIKGLEK